MILSEKDIESLIIKLQRANKKAITAIESLNKTGISDLTPRRNI